MGNVSHVSPAIHPLVDISEGEKLVPHTHEFALAARTNYADLALIRAGKGLALVGLDVLEDTEFRKKVRFEFNQRA